MVVNPYAILGVGDGASESDVKKAFRRLSRQHHPDLGGSATAFDAISRAYELIMSGTYESDAGSGKVIRLVHESLFNVVKKEM